jgi:hypothetical protein
MQMLRDLFNRIVTGLLIITKLLTLISRRV